MEAAPEGDSDACSEESTDYEQEREGDIEYREDAPSVFDPRDVEGGWAAHGDANLPTSVEEDESDNESDEDDQETITVGGVHYNVQAKRRRGNEDQQDGESIAMGE